MKTATAEIFYDYGEIMTMATHDNGERSLYQKTFERSQKLESTFESKTHRFIVEFVFVVKATT
jgi:hypothetical protein